VSSTDRKPAGRRLLRSGRQFDPMPMVPRPAGDATLAIGRAGVVVTVGVWAALVISVVSSQLLSGGHGRAGVLETVIFLVVVTFLAASATAYLVGRLGFYYRAREHRRVPRAMLDAFYASKTPTLTVLVPSYQEETDVIRMTLLSAALQEYPDMRVVLLIDDPPEPRYGQPARLLRGARAMPEEIMRLLAEPRARFDAALAAQEEVADGPRAATPDEVGALAAHYDEAADWVRRLSASREPRDHNERFFADHVLGQLESDLTLTAAALRGAAAAGAQTLPLWRVTHLYRRLAWTFRANVSSFERKRYLSLSHEPNKAMNLNSYIGLIGGRYREQRTPAGRLLAAAEPANATLTVPHSDYVLTLDADSVILPEYAARLVHLLEQRQHERVGVAQTPYSAFPGAATRIERIAAATTDIQHIIHQGMTFYGASFWVGANAVLRKAALDEVAETEYVGGWPIRRYIRDRTLIEDTESTIDLAAHGWTTYNYPERLAYSATPADFGSLCIQRHRWANGGLLIVPKLRRVIGLRRARGEHTSPGEMLLRLNYMASTFWSSVCVLFLLVFQFNGHLLTPLTVVAALPYFTAMAIDLRYCGYKPLDILRVYGFNLLLLPVNLAGSLSSVAQGLTGAKGRFQRTPKVRDRTVAGLLYVVLPYALIALSLYTFKHAVTHRQWTDAALSAVNTLLGSYAVLAFVGLRNSAVDIAMNVGGWLRPEARGARAPSRRPAPARVASDAQLADWESVLYLGADAAPAHAPARTRRFALRGSAEAAVQPD